MRGKKFSGGPKLKKNVEFLTIYIMKRNGSVMTFVMTFGRAFVETFARGFSPWDL